MAQGKAKDLSSLITVGYYIIEISRTVKSNNLKHLTQITIAKHFHVHLTKTKHKTFNQSELVL